MQEDLEQRTVSVSIQAAKLSGRVLRAAIAAVLQKMEQEHTMPKVGRNSMKRLTYKDPGANTIEVSGTVCQKTSGTLPYRKGTWDRSPKMDGIFQGKPGGCTDGSF